jgi:hypothetical protein
MRVVDGEVERSFGLPNDWAVDVGDPCLDLSEEELLVMAELAEEQDDPFVPPPRPCRALRRTRALRIRRAASVR